MNREAQFFLERSITLYWLNKLYPLASRECAVDMYYKNNKVKHEVDMRVHMVLESIQILDRLGYKIKDRGEEK